MDIGHAYFDFDNEAFAFEAVRRLAGMGRKHVVLISPPPGLAYYHHTLRGFERGLLEFGLSGSILADVNSDSETDTLVAAGRELEQRKERPDGIVCTTSNLALPLASGLSQAGLHIGRDYDIVAKPLNPLIKIALPEVIFIDEDFRLAGQELARMVMSRIAGTDPLVLQLLEQPK
jgi:LacI family transcriptional regulator